ncbi:MAG TPA: response regulator transcription factor, partial [Chloroflexi bacterium]|nr:response regulator transcription factor [Chloroflexota bacterium]
QLTGTELQILSYIAAGDTTREIAQKLHWSEATVNRRVQEILTKLNVSNRAHAVAEAIRRGLI